jgi:hypothetical protein
MKKPLWISFHGWASLTLFLFALTSAVLAKGQPFPPIPAAVAAAALLLAVPAFGIWLIASLVHRFRVSGARVKAEAFMEAQAKTGGRLGPVPAVIPGGKRAADPEGPKMCGMCNRTPGVMRCLEHDLLLCRGCWAIHDSTQHGSGAAAPQTGTR